MTAANLPYFSEQALEVRQDSGEKPLLPRELVLGNERVLSILTIMTICSSFILRSQNARTALIFVSTRCLQRSTHTCHFPKSQGKVHKTSFGYFRVVRWGFTMISQDTRARET